MGDRENRPVRQRVFRDEAQDIIPLDFGPFFAAARGRAGENNLEASCGTEIRTSNDAANED